MKQVLRSLMSTLFTVLASLPWGGIIPIVLSLLGLAGSATAVATRVTGWLSPLLLCASILLIGRTFYVIYVRKTASRATAVVAWCSLIFMIGFWTWYFVSGGIWPDSMGQARFVPGWLPNGWELDD